MLILHLSSNSLANLYPMYSPACWESKQPSDHQAAAAWLEAWHISYTGFRWGVSGEPNQRWEEESTGRRWMNRNSKRSWTWHCSEPRCRHYNPFRSRETYYSRQWQPYSHTACLRWRKETWRRVSVLIHRPLANQKIRNFPIRNHTQRQCVSYPARQARMAWSHAPANIIINSSQSLN